jgi:YD repeat-containing protein
MSDLAQHDVHGPVARLRTERASWDAAKDEWEPASKPTWMRFRPDGQIVEADPGITFSYDKAGRLLETKFQDGKILCAYDEKGRLIRTVRIDEKGNSTESEIFRYDSSGRKTRIQFVPKREDDVPMQYAIDGTELSIGAVGAATVTTLYDDHDLPVEALVHDAEHQVLRRATITRDSAGRVVKDEVLLGAGPLFPEMQSELKDAPPEARESLRAALAAAFGPNNVFVSQAYAYDEKGRRISRNMRMGNLRESRVTFLYDDHDNPIEVVDQETGGGRQRTRFVYKYDAQGNWTEKETWSASEQDKDFRRWSIERRQITYFQ